MSPPPNDPRSPKGRGPAEPPRLDRTIRELETQEFVPPQPQARPATTFGLAPMVTQPFPVFAREPPLPDPVSVPAPAPLRTSPVVQAQPAGQVSVGRMQGIGHQGQPSRPAQPPVAPPIAPQSFDRTFIAAGHRVVLDALPPAARPPVPAYPSQPPASQPYARQPPASQPYANQQPYASPPPASPPYASPPPASQPYASPPPVSQPYASPPPVSQPYASPPPASQRQPYEDTRSRLHEQVSRQPEPSSSRQLTPVPPRASEPVSRPQHAPTTSVDVNELLRAYPVPMPEVRLDEDSSTTWSEPMAEVPRYTPQSGRRARVQSNEPTHKELGRVEERPRLNMPGSTSERDDIDVDRVLGRSNMKVPLLAGAVVIALGLLGVSLYVKNARDTATAALAAAPEAVSAAVPPDPATSGVGAPTAGEQAHEADEPTPAPATQEARAPATDEAPRGREAAPAEHEAVPDEGEGAPAGREAPGDEREAAPATDDASAVHTTTGGVTAKSAAALYINGQYKEALAEYQLLARAYPKQQVYRELARILRRKLIETCMRTQPNRREQCKNM